MDHKIMMKNCSWPATSFPDLVLIEERGMAGGRKRVKNLSSLICQFTRSTMLAYLFSTFCCSSKPIRRKTEKRFAVWKGESTWNINNVLKLTCGIIRFGIWCEDDNWVEGEKPLNFMRIVSGNQRNEILRAFSGIERQRRRFALWYCGSCWAPFVFLLFSQIFLPEVLHFSWEWTNEMKVG